LVTSLNQSDVIETCKFRTFQLVAVVDVAVVDVSVIDAAGASVGASVGHNDKVLSSINLLFSPDPQPRLLMAFFAFKTFAKLLKKALLTTGTMLATINN
jgi:hypothetical protein